MAVLVYNECEMETGELEDCQSEFSSLHAAISGRSNEYNTITEPVSNHFSGMIGQGLKEVAADNREAWESALMACTHAFGILGKAIEDVNWYENRIDDIKTNLNSEVYGMRNIVDETGEMLDGVVEKYNRQAADAWLDFQILCEETESDLRAGPTPETIRKLAEGGYLGQIGYYTTGDIDYLYLDSENAEEVADYINEAVKNGTEFHIDHLEGEDGALALIAAIVSRAQKAQEEGTKLLDGEIDFMETLLDELGAAGGDPPNILDFVDEINESEHIDEGLKDELNRHLSNTSLVLSDEQIGGGYEYLPHELREVAEGAVPDTYNSGNVSEEEYNEWLLDYERLGDFFGSSGAGVQGGVDLSATLTATTARALEGPEDTLVGGGHLNEKTAEQLIDVSSRNEVANYIILSGEYPDGTEYEHVPNNAHMSNTDILETLYKHPWEDGGDAVSGITDWIHVNADNIYGSDNIELREKGLVALVSLFEDDDFKDSLLSTGFTVEDDEGEKWADVPAAMLNPSLAESWGEIFLTYMDEFSDTNGVGGNDEREVENLWSTEGITLNPESMLGFAESFMGNPETAENVYGNVLANTAEGMEEYFLGAGSEDSSHVDASQAGSVQGLIEKALGNVSSTIVENNNDRVAFYNEILGKSVDLASSKVGLSGAGGEVVKMITKEVIEISEKEDGDILITREDKTSTKEDMEGMVVALMSGESTVADIIEEIEERERNRDNTYSGDIFQEREGGEGRSGERFVPRNHEEWDVANSEGVMRDIYTEINEKPWGFLESDGDEDGKDKSISDAVREYLETLDGAKGRW